MSIMRFRAAYRFAPLDNGLLDRCEADMGNREYRVVLTHCDQEAPTQSADLSKQLRAFHAHKMFRSWKGK